MSESLNTKEKILECARDLIQTRSFNSFSYKDLAEALNIRKASVHYHFPSKTDLGVAILQDYRKYIQKLMSDLDARTDDPWKKIKSYFWYFSNIMKSGDRICTECVLTAEYNTLPEVMQVELQGLFDDHHSWLSEVLEDGRKKNLLKFKGTPGDKAIMIKATVQGALMVARAFGKPVFFQNVLEQLEEELRV
ncbi:MAG: TetR/AcrR family transcriptional regulator [Candidatus Odinarchaeota archaeon]